MAAPSPYTTLITPGGIPAASKRRIVWYAARLWFSAGFQTTTFPMSAHDAGRFPAMAVKLNGVIARTNPSSGLSSSEFKKPGGEMGWCSARPEAKATLNLRKSISSQAASISA